MAASDYGYHLPAAAYARSLKASRCGWRGDCGSDHSRRSMSTPAESGDNRASARRRAARRGRPVRRRDRRRALLIGALGVAQHSWRRISRRPRPRGTRPRLCAAAGLCRDCAPGDGGWTALYPSQAATHVVHAYSSALSDDEDALRSAGAASGLALTDVVLRPSEPGRREQAWSHNCVAVGAAACALDPVHNLDLHAVQLGLIQLLAIYPSSADFDAERSEYNRVMRGSLRAAARLSGRALRTGALSRRRSGTPGATRPCRRRWPIRSRPFRARGEIRADGGGKLPDRPLARAVRSAWASRRKAGRHGSIATPPEAMKAQFRGMLGFVKEQCCASRRRRLSASLASEDWLSRSASRVRRADLDALPPRCAGAFRSGFRRHRRGRERRSSSRACSRPGPHSRRDAVAGDAQRLFQAMDRGARGAGHGSARAAAGQFAYGPDLREFTFTKRQAPLGAHARPDREPDRRRTDTPTVAIQMLPLADALPDFVEQNPMPLFRPGSARACGSAAPCTRARTTIATIISPA